MTTLENQLKQAETELNQFLALPQVNRPITRFEPGDELLLDQLCDLWQKLDEIAREDQIARTQVTQARLREEARLGPALTRIRTPQGDFDDIESAALAMGIKSSSLKVYLTNNPKQYMRIA